MGASCRSDSVNFLIYLPGDHSDPMRISQGWCLLGAAGILQHPFALASRWGWGGLRFAPDWASNVQCDPEQPSSPLSLLVITFRPETSNFRPLDGAENALDQDKPSHKYKTVPNPICPCHMYDSLHMQTPDWCLQALPPLHPLSLAPSFVIVVGISWLHKEVSPPDCREMLLCTSWRWSAYR